jgi:hypothetical protein
MIIIFAIVLSLIHDFRIINIMSSHISWQIYRSHHQQAVLITKPFSSPSRPHHQAVLTTKPSPLSRPHQAVPTKPSPPPSSAHHQVICWYLYGDGTLQVSILYGVVYCWMGTITVEVPTLISGRTDQETITTTKNEYWLSAVDFLKAPSSISHSW